VVLSQIRLTSCEPYSSTVLGGLSKFFYCIRPENNPQVRATNVNIEETLDGRELSRSLGAEVIVLSRLPYIDTFLVRATSLPVLRFSSLHVLDKGYAEI